MFETAVVVARTADDQIYVARIFEYTDETQITAWADDQFNAFPDLVVVDVYPKAKNVRPVITGEWDIRAHGCYAIDSDPEAAYL